MFLSALSFIGGLAWLLARVFGARRVVLRFVLFYVGLSILLPIAVEGPLGQALNADNPRVRVSVGSNGLVTTPIIYPALHRNYVTPELKALTDDLSAHMNSATLTDPNPSGDTRVVVLDGSFPMFDGLPLLPHLSHDDGEKLDLSFFWTDANGQYLPGRSKSPIGYWGYVPGPTDCPKTWKDLRWDLDWLQPLLPDRRLDEARTRKALLFLARDPRVSKILIEPHIVARLDLNHPKIRFQGCRAARHDDHIHIQL